MQTDRLTSRQRALLTLGALLSVAALSMLQCALLSVDNGGRNALTLVSAGLALLCVSVLLEDAVEQPLRSWLRHFARRIRRAY